MEKYRKRKKCCKLYRVLVWLHAPTLSEMRGQFLWSSPVRTTGFVGWWVSQWWDNISGERERERVNYPGIGQSVSGAVDDCGGSDEVTDKQFCQHSPLEHLICSIRWEGSRLLTRRILTKSVANCWLDDLLTILILLKPRASSDILMSNSAL